MHRTDLDNCEFRLKNINLFFTWRRPRRRRRGCSSLIREFKITTTATATGTSLNKRFNEQNNGSARAL